ncbi:MAG: CoA-binding protein [Candidatus Sabulitectum sp.]|nr:CoA-binding protein [Candidatus Sabulitectum sp.]
MSTVLLVGASNDASRYSNKALYRLIAHGHRVIPVNPYSEIDTAEPTVHHLSEVDERIDIAVIYVRAELLEPDIEELVRIAPSTVIFNPGAESIEMKNELERNGIGTRNACTLVLLSIGQFDLEQE